MIEQALPPRAVTGSSDIQMKQCEKNVLSTLSQTNLKSTDARRVSFEANCPPPHPKMSRPSPCVYVVMIQRTIKSNKLDMSSLSDRPREKGLCAAPEKLIQEWEWCKMQIHNRSSLGMTFLFLYRGWVSQIVLSPNANPRPEGSGLGDENEVRESVVSGVDPRLPQHWGRLGYVLSARTV